MRCLRRSPPENSYPGPQLSWRLSYAIAPAAHAPSRKPSSASAGRQHTAPFGLSVGSGGCTAKPAIMSAIELRSVSTSRSRREGDRPTRLFFWSKML
jgi:hypothetical protein